MAGALVLIVAATGPAAAAEDDPLAPSQWGLGVIDAPGPGAGGAATVALISSGVDASHEDLAGRVIAQLDCRRTAGAAARCAEVAPADTTGWGTHAAGVVAAIAGNGAGGRGVATEAHLVAISVASPNGQVSGDDVVAAIDAAAERGVTAAVIAIPESVVVTAPVAGRSLADAEAAAADAGVLVVRGAGTLQAMTNPAAGTIEPALVVASVDRAGQPWGVVPQGARWEAAAPGGAAASPGAGADQGVLSTWLAGGYSAQSGSWVAAAFAAGAVAAAHAAYEDVAVTADRLVASGHATTARYPALLDVSAAAPATAPTASSPAAAPATNPQPSTAASSPDAVDGSPTSATAPAAPPRPAVHRPTAEPDAPPGVLDYGRARIVAAQPAGAVHDPSAPSPSHPPLPPVPVVAIALLCALGGLALLIVRHASRPAPTPVADAGVP